MRLSGALALSGSKSSLIISWTLLNFSSLQVEVPGWVDVKARLFLFTVLIITAAVLVFSQSYMAHEKFFLRFHLLVGSFVFSIILLILSPNLLSLLLGWDGLGVTSYLLVIYFQSSKSFNAGLLTALSNRVGDVLILATLALLWRNGSWNFRVWGYDTTSTIYPLAIGLLLLAACTKRAQIPFSAWLPAAIAAPTPVSSLVHSSTLVTAGVYLLTRFNEFLSSRALLFYILVVGALTMILAGLRAIWEQDIKKIVALSTLSQLGLIITCIGLGLSELAFTHLLAHAFFKALLFITVGNIIHLSSDYQDLRKITLSPVRLPVRLAFSLIANASLCGFPFTAGFYSKDLIFEVALMGSLGGGTLGLLILAFGLTLAYTFRFLFLALWKASNRVNLLWAQDNDLLMLNSIRLLWPLAIRGGRLVCWIIFYSPEGIFLPVELKNLILVFLSLTLGLSTRLATFHWHRTPSPLAWSWGLMWALPLVRAFTPNYHILPTAGMLRKLDLSWAPLYSLSPIPAITQGHVAEKLNNPKNLFYSFAVLASLSFFRVLIYLCILKLLKSWKFKTSCALHPNIISQAITTVSLIIKLPPPLFV